MPPAGARPAPSQAGAARAPPRTRARIAEPPTPVRLGPPQVSQRRPNIRLDPAPEEPRVLLRHVGRITVAEPLGSPGLDQLMEQCRQLAGVGWVGKLSDQVCRSHQAGFGLGLGMVPVLRHREPGQLDGPAQPLDIKGRDRGAAAADEELGALDMPGRQEGVRGTARCRYRVAGVIDDIASVAVAWADPAQVADVVQQGGDREMEPALRETGSTMARPRRMAWPTSATARVWSVS